MAIHRLSQAEYSNTVIDLLGVSGSPGTSGLPIDPVVDDFDNNADALQVNPDLYRWYFASARLLADQVFADAGLTARIMTCSRPSLAPPAPGVPPDTTCARSIVTTFGRRAWRRPLTDDEVTGLVQLAADAQAAGFDFARSIEEVVVALLASDSFLYRIEFDPDPNSVTPHPLSPYELASRLSYLLWSTMPDDELFARAAASDLTRSDVLTAQVTRMLSDPRSDAFVHNFAGQWLGFRELGFHVVDQSVFPIWGDALRNAMQEEAFLYFAQFRDRPQALSQLLSANVNYVNAPLAQLYAITLPDAGDALARVDHATDVRKGFLGLAAFLTATSRATESFPSLRGQWIADRFLCSLVPRDPSGDVSPPGSPRARLAAIAATPSCAACHERIDPLGLGLENFDAIGQFRTQYRSGELIDATGVIPDNIPFRGLPELADKLAQDPRVVDCVARKALIYALGRGVGSTDDAYVSQILATWNAEGQTLHSLLAQIALSDTFRMRRGEAP